MIWWFCFSPEWAVWRSLFLRHMYFLSDLDLSWLNLLFWYPQTAFESWSTAMGSLSCCWMELPWHPLSFICCCTLFRGSRVEMVLYRVQRKKMGANLQEMVLADRKFSQMRPLQGGTAQNDCISFTSVSCYGHEIKVRSGTNQELLNPHIFHAS